MVAQRVAGAARGAGDGTALDAASFHADEHFGGRADQLLIPELQQKLVRARAEALDALEQFAGTAAETGGKALPQNDLIVVALFHARAHALHFLHVLRGRVVGYDLEWRGRRWN